MGEQPPIQLVRATRLTLSELAAVKELAATCNAFEQLDLKLDLDVLSGENTGIPAAHALAYRGDRLVGFATITLLDEYETCGMVLPSERRNGVGSALLGEMRAAARRQGCTAILVLAEVNSRSGTAFVLSHGGVHAFSEHRMALEADGLQRTGQTEAEGIRLRRATFADIDTIAAIRSAAFGEPEAEAHNEVEEVFAHFEPSSTPGEYYLLAERGGHSVATLRVIVAGDREFVYGFGVRPSEQGKHIGRAVLGAVAEHAFARGVAQVALEVVTTNERALRAYRACGFQLVTTYGYYRVIA